MHTLNAAAAWLKLLAAVCQCPDGTFMQQPCNGQYTYVGDQANDNGRGNAVCASELAELNSVPVSNLHCSVLDLPSWPVHRERLRERWRNQRLSRHCLQR